MKSKMSKAECLMMDQMSAKKSGKVMEQIKKKNSSKTKYGIRNLKRK